MALADAFEMLFRSWMCGDPKEETDLLGENPRKGRDESECEIGCRYTAAICTFCPFTLFHSNNAEPIMVNAAMAVPT